MSELDDKLGAILSNPQMMQQIMSLAQALNSQTDAAQAQQKPPEPAPELPQLLNPNLLSKISTLMQHGTIDQDQKALLKALSPYLSRHKLQKLERAMHAAKMAGIATEMVNPQGQSPFSRR